MFEYTHSKQSVAVSGRTSFTIGLFGREAATNHLLFHVLNGLSPLWGYGIKYKTKTLGQGSKTIGKHHLLLIATQSCKNIFNQTADLLWKGGSYPCRECRYFWLHLRFVTDCIALPYGMAAYLILNPDTSETRKRILECLFGISFHFTRIYRAAVVCQCP